MRQRFIGKFIDFFIGLVEIILVFRIVLKLFGANPDASFVHWIYQTSDTLLAPFRGIFPPAVVNPRYVLDISALFAVLVYALVGYLLNELLNMVPARHPKR